MVLCLCLCFVFEKCRVERIRECVRHIYGWLAARYGVQVEGSIKGLRPCDFLRGAQAETTLDAAASVLRKCCS